MFVVLLGFGMSPKTQKIEEPAPNRPAAAAGLKAGDVLVEANGQVVDAEHPISEVIKAGQGAPVSIKVLRDGKQMTFLVTPDRTRAPTRSASRSARTASARRCRSEPPPRRRSSIRTTRRSRSSTGLYDMIRGKVQADLSGPIGITKQIAKAANRGAVNFLSMLMMLSVYLGLFNLLPLPALDGGRAVFLGVESVMRRRVNPRIEAAVHTAGFVLLFGVLLVVSFKDIFGKG